jgi:Protein of unknown function (DUF1475)
MVEEVSENMALNTSDQQSPRFNPTSLLISKVVSGVLSIAFFMILIITIQTDGSPFRSELLIPWMKTTLVDYYLTLLPTLAWACFRERASIGRQILVSLFLCCLGSFAVWTYIFTILSTRIKAGDPVSKLVS